MNYTFYIKKNGTKMEHIGTHSIRRFTHHLRTINWENGPLKIYLLVYYGREIDHRGKLVRIYNDGVYENEIDLFQAFSAFTEPNLTNTNVLAKNKVSG